MVIQQIFLNPFSILAEESCNENVQAIDDSGGIPYPLKSSKETPNLNKRSSRPKKNTTYLETQDSDDNEGKFLRYNLILNFFLAKVHFRRGLMK